MSDYATGHDICLRLKQRRLQLGMTQIDLALAAGTNNRAISRYEHGRRLPKLQEVLDLANAMGLDISIDLPMFGGTR